MSTARWFDELPANSSLVESVPPRTSNTRGMRVCIESPFSGDVALNVRYADALLSDSLQRGEFPFMGHLLYPRVLNDQEPEMRERGIAAHLAFLGVCDAVVIALDLCDPTPGMLIAVMRAESLGKTVIPRFIGKGWERYQVTPTPGTRWR
jgi:hypothetical protein